jgi:cytochrome c
MAVYQAKCGGCHSLDTNRIGPAHRGVVGRKLGSVAGFAYSPALKRLSGVWTPARLDQWLAGPQKVAPGSKMFLSVADPKDRASIIAYLQSAKAPAPARK